MTFQPPTVVAKLPIYHSLLNKQAPLPPEKAGNKNQKLILFSQGAAISGAPNFGGVGQFPKLFPLIKIGIPVKKIITKAWAVTMTLYSWSFPNEGPDWPRSLRISIFRPVPSIPLHAPPPYKIQDLATPNNLFFLGGGFVMNEARAALSGFDPATTKILEPFFIITGVWVEFWNACDW